MSDWTDVEREAMARAAPGDIEVWALELRHSTFPGGVYRYVAYTRDLDLPLEAIAPLNAGETVTHIAMPFETKPSAMSSQPGATMKVSVNAIGGAAEDKLAAANATVEIIEATVRSYDVNVLGHQVIRRMQAIRQQVRHITNNGGRLELTLGRPNAANSAFPSVLHTPESNPGLIQ